MQSNNCRNIYFFVKEIFFQKAIEIFRQTATIRIEKLTINTEKNL
jgi:hypothetical protein